ncbi:hypothetical protein D9M69_516260 [compost metagenome]
MKARHQRRDMAAAEAGRRGHAQVATGLHAAGAHAGLGVRELGQEALAVFEKGTAFVRERDAARGAHQQLDAQAFFERVDATAHDRGRHAFRLGRRGEAAAGRDRDKGFELLEAVHGAGTISPATEDQSPAVTPCARSTAMSPSL